VGWRGGGGEKAWPLRPRSHVSWYDSSATLSKCVAWVWLPSEAQWEYGCRAGTRTPWWTGKDAQSLVGAANIRHEEQSVTPRLLTIGQLRPNPFGLHDLLGALEWCRDAWGLGATRQPGDGVFDQPDSPVRVLRGGLSWSGATSARSSLRYGRQPDGRSGDYGLRPVRGITP